MSSTTENELKGKHLSWYLTVLQASTALLIIPVRVSKLLTAVWRPAVTPKAEPPSSSQGWRPLLLCHLHLGCTGEGKAPATTPNSVNPAQGTACETENGEMGLLKNKVALGKVC